MLNKHRNALYELIRSANLNPKRFKHSDNKVNGKDTFQLSVGGGGLYFAVQDAIVSDKREFHCFYSSVSFDYSSPTYSQYQLPGWYDFDRVEERFEVWLNSYAKVLIAIQEEEEEDELLTDLWSELELPSGSAADFVALQNTPFSPDERERLVNLFKEFEKEVQERNLLSEEQARLLHERIEYLVASSKRLGRKDWLMAAAGAIFGYTLQAGLTTNTATQLIHLADEALRWIAHTPFLLPGHL
ncbi:MAG: hypothetical protein ABW250_22445 [Pyrinomonadaceae bacterium]